MKISIITVCYNSEKTIARTIESVLNQTYSNFEYLIIDGLSSDNTVAIAKSYEKAFNDKKISYRIISEKDNGMYDAINKGIQLSTGDVIGCINSDDWLELDAFKIVADTYEETAFDMFYADLRIIKPTGSFVKHSKKSRLVVSRYWNHPTSYFDRKVFNKYLYRCQCMYDDFDLWLRVMKDKSMKVVIKNVTIANFVMGGMSNKKSIKDALYRYNIRKKIYKQNGYSKFYYFDCFLIEFVKLILS